VSTREQYDLDYRNPKHGSVSWTSCSHDHCATHYEEKVDSGWFPSRYPQCKWKWFECKNDKCSVHLWDKRDAKHFPGHDDPADIIQMQLLVNCHCTQAHWQTCLHEECRTHQKAKEANGFGSEQSFLGLRNGHRTPKPIDQRLAPGIDPEHAPLPGYKD